MFEPDSQQPPSSDGPGGSTVAATLLDSLARTTDADVQACYLKEAQTRT
jgi:hypothetical protein